MSGQRAYASVVAAYWGFTLTDGALRMLVLFHLHELGHSPLAVVSLFSCYEVFGVVTNLAAGLLGARFGLKATLAAGLSLQVLACALLAAGSGAPLVTAVLVAQAVSGIAKDLTKSSAKSYVKLVAPADDRRGLLRLVALLTGSKNALKGVGFFVGGLLLETVGFRAANVGMAMALGAALLASTALLPRAPGKAKGKVALRSVFDADRRIRALAAARLFLFGSRDAWFVFALPVFLGTTLGWSTTAVGSFLATWVIGYGIVQALAPRWLRGGHGAPPDGGAALRWTALLLLPLGGTAIALQAGAAPAVVLAIGLALYGFVFATGSSLHSYLIVDYARGDRVALNVGFYYMANAAGRLLGTVLSGIVYQAAGGGTDGLVACLGTAAILVVLSVLATAPLRAAERAVA